MEEDSLDLLSDDEIDLSDIEYKPKKQTKKEKKVKPIDKPDKTMNKNLEKQIIKKPKKELPTDEEIINKRRLILMIEFYKNEFGDKLKSFKKINLEKKTHDELVDIRKEIDFTISQSSSVKAGVQLISTGIQTLEFFMTNFTPINAQGLSNICNDPETIDTMKHITLKHSHMVSVEPEARLLYKVLTTSMMLHNINSAPINELKNNDIIKEINDDFVDI